MIKLENADELASVFDNILNAVDTKPKIKKTSRKRQREEKDDDKVDASCPDVKEEASDVSGASDKDESDIESDDDANDSSLIKVKEETTDDEGRVAFKPARQPKKKIKIKLEPGVTKPPSKATIKKLWINQFRVKPDLVRDRELERGLKRIATSGVVQLFNTIRIHQAQLQETIDRSKSTTQMEKSLKNINTSRHFLDLLSKKRSAKIGPEEEEDRKPELTQKHWNVLRSDFMETNDWDKES